ncbi:UNVERIFIED_CONTAM: hypothetical protein Slati_3798700 [Sesamum latifolium]|uniref:Uncharacterized protein n=1 Tax=Sesamum latifolium TaxID=2727402 RepID=A0AAW2U4G1_9LAMI
MNVENGNSSFSVEEFHILDGKINPSFVFSFIPQEGESEVPVIEALVDGCKLPTFEANEA